MPALPWFPLFVEDWSRSTANLTPEQKGVYIDLLAHAWLEGGLPANGEACRRIARADRDEWSRIWPALREKWVEQAGRLVNLRQERERGEASRLADRKSAGGKKSAASRLAKYGTARPRPIEDASEYSSEESSELSSEESSVEMVPMPCEESSEESLKSLPEESSEESSGNVKSLHAQYTDHILESPKGGDSKRAPAREPSPSPALPLSTFDRRNAALELCEAWRLATGVVVDASTLAPADLRRFGAALMQRDLDAWRRIFATVAASDYLSGRDGQHAPVTLWRALDLGARIEAGEFADRPKPAPKVAGLRGGGVTAAPSRAVSVVDPDTGYRFVCEHGPACATWPAHRDRVNAETPREVVA